METLAVFSPVETTYGVMERNAGWGGSAGGELTFDLDGGSLATGVACRENHIIEKIT
jgi:hypothetical protein